MLLPDNIRRIFFAVAAPPETMALIDDLKTRLPAHKALKWMRPQNLHLTVFFVGNIEREKYDLMIEKCREVISSFSPFSLKFDGIACMPSQKPYMLWAKYLVHEGYTEIYHAIHDCLKPYLKDNPGVYTNPVPHITLARFHGLRQNNFLNISSDVLLPEIYIGNVVIWETESKTGQSDYIRHLNSFGLKDNKKS